MRKLLCGAAVLSLPLLHSTLLAQEPGCKNCSATYVSNEELQAYLKRGMQNVVADQQVRALDVGKINVDIGIVWRGKLAGSNNVAEHDLVGEVYHILDGEATLVTGADLVGAVRRPANNIAVQQLNGPSSNGTSIRNGVTHHLKAGDVIVIPAGVGHWFTEIPDHVSYLMVRLDPDKVVPLKDEAASQADLKNNATAPNQPGRNNTK